MSWSQFNEFPHHTFNWRGIDGTEILTHFPPENTYNSELDTEFLVPAQTNFKEKEFIDEFISLFVAEAVRQSKFIIIQVQNSQT
jgi:alpha-mannosidase